MAKIHYESDGVFGKTECPYGHRSGFGTIKKVNSINCRNHCEFYRSTNYREKYVVCLADCSSQLDEILDKIDVVIANDMYDDICFEEFFAEIREGIAKILDGLGRKAKEDSK